MISLRHLLVTPCAAIAETLCGLDQVMPRNIADGHLPLELHVSVADTIWNHF